MNNSYNSSNYTAKPLGIKKKRIKKSKVIHVGSGGCMCGKVKKK